MDNGGSEPTVSVILINYNGGRILSVIEQAIESVRRQSMPDWELILVDDGSTDGSGEFLASFADGQRTRFVQAPHRGVGAARNAGLRIAQGRYLAFLDNDAIPASGWLEHVVTFLEAHPEHGAVASLVFFADRPGVINSAGCVLNELAHGIGVGMHQLYPFFSPPDEIMYATGNGMVIRREALERAGWFDEGYLFYGHDDSDIGIRIRNAGYSITPVRDAVLQHLHSTSKQDPEMNFWDQRNRLRFVLKHYGAWEIARFILTDVPAHLKGPDRRVYGRAWRSAMQDWQRVGDYRTQHRKRQPFLQRYARFFSSEHRYIVIPDNRNCARVWQDIEQGFSVGAREEDYLYQGWYWREHQQSRWIRWAMPVASLRFFASRPLQELVLVHLLPPSIEEQRLKAYLYPWSERWYLNPPLASAEVVIRGNRVGRSVVPFSPRPHPGQFLLAFEAARYSQEVGYFPRRLAWGLVGMEVCTCVS